MSAMDTPTDLSHDTIYVTSDSGIEFYDVEACIEYMRDGGESTFKMYRRERVCRASADFQALSYTTEFVYAGTFNDSGFQV